VAINGFTDTQIWSSIFWYLHYGATPFGICTMGDMGCRLQQSPCTSTVEVASGLSNTSGRSTWFASAVGYWATCTTWATCSGSTRAHRQRRWASGLCTSDRTCRSNTACASGEPESALAGRRWGSEPSRCRSGGLQVQQCAATRIIQSCLCAAIITARAARRRSRAIARARCAHRRTSERLWEATRVSLSSEQPRERARADGQCLACKQERLSAPHWELVSRQYLFVPILHWDIVSVERL
jgi:hypothetical protein